MNAAHAATAIACSVGVTRTSLRGPWLISMGPATLPQDRDRAVLRARGRRLGDARRGGTRGAGQHGAHPPGVMHGAVGKMRVLVVGIPDIDDSDVYV